MGLALLKYLRGLSSSQRRKEQRVKPVISATRNGNLTGTSLTHPQGCSASCDSCLELTSFFPSFRPSFLSSTHLELLFLYPCSLRPVLWLKFVCGRELTWPLTTSLVTGIFVIDHLQQRFLYLSSLITAPLCEPGPLGPGGTVEHRKGFPAQPCQG